MSKHSQTLIDNNKHSSTTSDTATRDDGHSRTTVEHDERTVEGNNRSTETHSSNAQGVVKNKHWVEKRVAAKKRTVDF